MSEVVVGLLGLATLLLLFLTGIELGFAMALVLRPPPDAAAPAAEEGLKP